MTIPLNPAVAASSAAPAVAVGPNPDIADLAAIIAADAQITVARQHLADRHTMDGAAPVMLALARIAGLSEQIDIEVRLIRHYWGGE